MLIQSKDINAHPKQRWQRHELRGSTGETKMLVLKLEWSSKVSGMAATIQGPAWFFVPFLSPIRADPPPLPLSDAFSFSLQFFQN